MEVMRGVRVSGCLRSTHLWKESRSLFTRFHCWRAAGDSNLQCMGRSKNTAVVDQDSIVMSDRLRRKLDKLYKPYNEELVEMLGGRQFSWTKKK